MGEILPYLGVEPSYSAEELLGSDTTVNYVIGMTVADAEEKLKSKGFSVKVVGDGDTVTDQTPEGGTVIPGKSLVISMPALKSRIHSAQYPPWWACPPARRIWR